MLVGSRVLLAKAGRRVREPRVGSKKIWPLIPVSAAYVLAFKSQMDALPEEIREVTMKKKKATNVKTARNLPPKPLSAKDARRIKGGTHRKAGKGQQEFPRLTGLAT